MTIVTVSTQLRHQCEQFDILDSYRVHQLIEVLETSAQSLARDPNARFVLAFTLIHF